MNTKQARRSCTAWQTKHSTCGRERWHWGGLFPLPERACNLSHITSASELIGQFLANLSSLTILYIRVITEVEQKYSLFFFFFFTLFFFFFLCPALQAVWIIVLHNCDEPAWHLEDPLSLSIRATSHVCTDTVLKGCDLENTSVKRKKKKKKALGPIYIAVLVSVL